MPKGIVFRTVKRYYDKDTKDYYDKNGEYCAVLNNQYITKNLNEEVELIEEQQDIDIQAIEEMTIRPYRSDIEKAVYIESKYNELLKAVKQLDRNIRKEK